MLFSKLYKIVMNKVTFVAFSGGDRPLLDPLPWLLTPFQNLEFF